MSEEQKAPVGFFERRWRMLKAGVKKVFSYLFDPKTYIYAGVMFGTAALAGHYLPDLPLAQGMAKTFGVADGSATSVLMGMGRAILMGTLINATVAMVKESNECNNCAQTDHQPAVPEQQTQQVVSEVAKHLTHGLSELGNASPPSVPHVPVAPGSKPPFLGM